MPKTRSQKEETVRLYSDKLKEAKSVVFVNYQGLKVKETVEFRKKCREEGAEYLVAKKTLMKLALKDAGLPVDIEKLPGDVGTIFGFEDEITAAKITHGYAKTHESLKPIAGILEKSLIDSAKVMALSKLPSRKEMLAKIVGSLQAPVNGFVRVLAENLRGLMQVLTAVRDKKV